MKTYKINNKGKEIIIRSEFKLDHIKKIIAEKIQDWKEQEEKAGYKFEPLKVKDLQGGLFMIVDVIDTDIEIK